MAESGLARKKFTIDFHFKDLGLVLKSSKKVPQAALGAPASLCRAHVPSAGLPLQVIMKGVTGTIKHGQVTAVMGPSGAGAGLLHGAAGTPCT